MNGPLLAKTAGKGPFMALPAGGSDAGDLRDPGAVPGDVGVRGVVRPVAGRGDADLAAAGEHRAARVTAGGDAVDAVGTHRDTAGVVAAADRVDPHVGDLEVPR